MKGKEIGKKGKRDRDKVCASNKNDICTQSSHQTAQSFLVLML